MRAGKGIVGCHWQIKFCYFENLEEYIMDKVGTGIKGNTVPIWEKYMLTVDEAAQYFGIGEKKIRMLIAENAESDYCFTVQVGNKSLVNRQKFEKFLNQTTAL
jgi:conserved domain protein